MNHLNRDEAHRRDNRNGPLNMAANLERELRAPQMATRLEGLRKVQSKLTSSSRFAKVLVDTPLLAIIVRRLVEARMPSEEASLCKAIVSRGARFHPAVLDALARSFYHDILDALYANPTDEALLEVISAFGRSAAWTGKLCQSTDLIDFLTRSHRFAILERVPESAIHQGAVTEAVNFLASTRPSKSADAQREAALRFLLQASHFPRGRNEAIAQGAVARVTEIAANDSEPTQLRAPAMGVIGNLCNDPRHEARREALEADVPRIAANALANFRNTFESAESTLSTAQTDLGLFTMHTIATLAIDPAARTQLQQAAPNLAFIAKTASGPRLADAAREALNRVQWVP